MWSQEGAPKELLVLNPIPSISHRNTSFPQLFFMEMILSTSQLEKVYHRVMANYASQHAEGVRSISAQDLRF
jgi:hypothetical protein